MNKDENCSAVEVPVLPSYRYTRDIRKEDLAPEPVPEYTKKERRANWWHYHWKAVAAILVGVALVGALAAELLRAKPADIGLAVVAPDGLPAAVLEKLEEELAGLVGDANGDGHAVAEVYSYTLTLHGSAQDSADPYGQMAGVAQLSAAMGSAKGPNLVLLHPDEAAAYQEAYSLLVPLAFGDEGLPGLERCAVRWGDVPALAGLNLVIETPEGSYDAQPLLAGYLVGVRDIEAQGLGGDEKAAAGQSMALALLAGWMNP